MVGKCGCVGWWQGPVWCDACLGFEDVCVLRMMVWVLVGWTGVRCSAAGCARSCADEGVLCCAEQQTGRRRHISWRGSTT